jgi:hypothetical protein
MTRIIVPGSLEVGANKIYPVVPNGLVGLWLFGQTMEKSRRNHADNGVDALVVGEPVLTDRYMSFKGGSDYLITDVRETNSLTLIAVARTSEPLTTNAARPHLISNFLGSTGGASLSVTGTPSAAPQAYVSSSTYRDVNGVPTSGGSTVTVEAINTWRFLAGVHSPTMSSVYDLSAGVEDVDARTGTRILKPNVPFRIGSSEGTQFLGACDIAFAMIYNRALAKIELEALRAQFAQFLLDTRSIAS